MSLSDKIAKIVSAPPDQVTLHIFHFNGAPAKTAEGSTQFMTIEDVQELLHRRAAAAAAAVLRGD